MERRRLGELLVAKGLITQDQLDDALHRHRMLGLRLGEVLVSQGLVSEEQIDSALSEQSVPGSSQAPEPRIASPPAAQPLSGWFGGPAEQLSDLVSTALSHGASMLYFQPEAAGVRIFVRSGGQTLAHHLLAGPPSSTLMEHLSGSALQGVIQEGSCRMGWLRVPAGHRDLVCKVFLFPAPRGWAAVCHLVQERGGHVFLHEMELDPVDEAALEHFVQGRTGLLVVAGPEQDKRTDAMYALLRHAAGRSMIAFSLESQIRDPVNGVIQLENGGHSGEQHMVTGIASQEPDLLALHGLPDLLGSDAVRAFATRALVFADLPAAAPAELSQLLLAGPGHRWCLWFRTPVRRLCPDCSRLVAPSAEVLRELREAARGKPVLREPRGCSACGQSGYSGTVMLQAVSTSDRSDPAGALRRSSLRLAAAGIIDLADAF